MTDTAVQISLRHTTKFKRPEIPDFSEALCRRHNQNIWFTSSTRTKAMEICKKCPIIKECYQYAIGLPIDTQGVMAGLSQYQLNKLRYKNIERVWIEHGTPAGYSAHRKTGVPVCEECKMAVNEHQKERKQK